MRWSASVIHGARGIHQYGISNYNDPGYAPLYLGDTTNNCSSTVSTAPINNRGSIGDSWYNAMVMGLRGRIKGVQAECNVHLVAFHRRL